MIKISATLYKVSFINLKEVLTYFFGSYNLTTKIRVFGEEFKYSDSTLEFYCYSSLDKKWLSNDENFIIDAFLKMNQEDLLNFIDSFSQLLRKNNIIYDIEYIEQDENAIHTSEETSIRHPDYYEFMKTYNDQ